MIARIVAIAVLCVFVGLPCLAAAEEIVVFGNDYKVPKIYAADGEPKGILVDILHWADERMDHSFSIRLFPWARAYNNALEARGGIIGLSMTEERLGIFDFSDPVYHDEVILVVLRGKDFPYRDINDLAGLRVGIGRSGSFGDEFEHAKASGLFVVEEDNGPVMRLHKLLLGRIDVALLSPGIFALNETLALDSTLNENACQFVALDRPFKRDPNYLAFAKEMEMGELLEEFNAVLQQGLDSGEIQAIIDSYTLAP